MSKIIFYFFVVFVLSSCGYRIEQKVVQWGGNDDKYNVETLIWKDMEIVWSHYTFQEAECRGWKSYIPLDSVPSVKKRDYETAQKVLKTLKEVNY